MDTRTIRPATLADAAYLSHLQKKFSNQLGFLPRPALDTYADKGWALIGTENQSEAGYLLGRPAYRWQPAMVPITQAAVAMDAQRKQLGLMLVNEWCRRAHAAKKLAVQCCCANDIDAMRFWPEAGFTAVCELNPENARGRKMTVWRKPLTSILPGWFMQTPPVSGYRAKRTEPAQLFLFEQSHAHVFR